MIDMDKIYLITDIPGYTPQISRLLSMMNYARHTTLETTENLTVDQLDFLLDSESNSIGALLMHFAAVEYAYQVGTFEKRELNDEEMLIWGAALELGEEGRRKIRGNNLNYYLDKLNEVRNRTYEFFRTVNDDWLYQEEEFWYQKQANHYFMWFHVFEDEINHRGQIRMIKKRLNV
ncbi:putative damage-inducible protein DinB [Fontibacillus solani]|uniref:Putative damage-inducible protein DinB n=1 Tax=Fontibacillus solani TaxID=1572857 RepID=A0A7W3SUF4_9BACL|nr:DinB family protein [Fontibacillus solani]MBA9086183.1 putative damage-inducible protein DinB [Fontibacillus solani]